MFRTINSSGVGALNGRVGLSPMYDRPAQDPTGGDEKYEAETSPFSGGGAGVSKGVAELFASPATSPSRVPGRALTYLQLMDYAQNGGFPEVSRAAVHRWAMITGMAAWNDQSRAGGNPADARRALDAGAKAMDAYHELGMYREMELTYIDMVEIMTSLSEKDATFGQELVRMEKHDDGSAWVTTNLKANIAQTLSNHFGEYVWRNGLRVSGFRPITGDSFRKALVKEAEFWKKNGNFIRAKMLHEAAAELSVNIADAAASYQQSFRATVGLFKQSRAESGIFGIGEVHHTVLMARLMALASRDEGSYFEIVDEQIRFVMELDATEVNAGFLLETAALLRDEVDRPDAQRDPDYRAFLWERRGDILTKLGDTHAANMSYVRAEEALYHSRSPETDASEVARIHNKVRPVTIDEELHYGGLSRWIDHANIYCYPIVVDKIAHYYRISRDDVDKLLEEGNGDLFERIKRDLGREGRDIGDLLKAREVYMAEKAEISRTMRELKRIRS